MGSITSIVRTNSIIYAYLYRVRGRARVIHWLPTRTQGVSLMDTVGIGVPKPPTSKMHNVLYAIACILLPAIIALGLVVIKWAL